MKRINEEDSDSNIRRKLQKKITKNLSTRDRKITNLSTRNSNENKER